MTIGTLKERLKAYPDDMHCAYSLWTPGDVRSHLFDAAEPTDEQVDATLDAMHRRQDADVGLNWAALEDALPDDYGR